VRKATIFTALCGALQGACTFYTACPDNPPAPANTAGSSNSGGGSDGGGGTDSQGGSDPKGGNDSNGGGPPLIKWANATSNLAGLDSVCGNLTSMAVKGERVFAAVAPGQLFASTNAGEDWTLIGQGEGTDPIDANIITTVLDPEHSDTFWLSGIYGSKGIWRTDDDGETFKVLGDARHNDVLSVDFTDPDRQFLIAGGHEQNQTIWRSFDGGEMWESIGDAFPGNTPVSSYPHILNSNVVLMGAAGYGGGKPGIFRSTDAGDSWERVSSSGGLGRPLIASTGVFYWAGENGEVVKSEDDGESWEEVVSGGTVWSGLSVLELPDGRFALLTQRDGVKLADKDFKKVTQIIEPIPFLPTGLVYSPSAKAFFVWHADCGNAVLDDAILRADFDYEAY
jgi:photosystem II stability/assembly factor-like uncharacterized protein